jgi:hypothetical protein
LSSKHQKSIFGNALETLGNQNMLKLCSLKFSCDNCNKYSKNRSGLWKHNKKCSLNKIETQQTVSEKDLILTLLNQNNQLQNQIIELCKERNNVQIINNTNGSINSHNKAFNLNFFLNETCKDAMNIMDFVDSIKLQLSDLVGVGEVGYVEGISNIIVKNLNELDVTQRPVHCTDKKRETLYIKDEDKWEKDEEKKKMHNLVKKVAYKNSRLLPKFKEAYPDCNKSTSKYSDQYNKIIIESMGGHGDNEYEKTEKIIKKVSKEVFVEKEL